MIVVVKCDKAAMVAEKIQTLPVLVEGELVTATENIESECSRENHLASKASKWFPF